MSATPANPTKPQPPAPHPAAAPGRRSFLTLTALTALGAGGVPVMAGCRLSRGGVGSGGGGASDGGGASAGASGGASAGGGPSDPLAWQDLDGQVMGHHVTARVSPLVRVDDQVVLLVVNLTRAADDATVADVLDTQSSPDPTQQNTIDLANYLGDPPSHLGASFTHLIDPDGMRVLRPVAATGEQLKVDLGQTVTSNLVFNATGIDQLDHVTVYVPQTGFTTVGVIDRAEATGAGIDPQTLDDLDQALKEHRASAPTTPDAGAQNLDAGPVPIERYTRALDDSTGTRTTDKDVTVTLASDVTFDSDSYNLTAAADAQLQTVADQIAQYPDGGNLDIVGHTDDVADNAHNQTLSENRAGTVKDRLGQLAALTKWQITTTGKGETEPAINDTTDEARAANRRVVITITPTSGTTAKQPGTTGTATPPAPPASDTGLPEAQGPVGTGPDGVTVPGPDGKGQITITLDHVTRNGGLLTAQLTITTGPGGTDDATLTTWLKDPAQAFASSRGENGGASAVGIANGLTLLADGQRLYPTDYLPPDSTWHHPMTEMYTYKSLKEGATTTICVAWPDTAQDTLTLDHQGNMNTTNYAFRLTNIPTTTA